MPKSKMDCRSFKDLLGCPTYKLLAALYPRILNAGQINYLLWTELGIRHKTAHVHRDLLALSKMRIIEGDACGARLMLPAG